MRIGGCGESAADDALAATLHSVWLSGCLAFMTFLTPWSALLVAAVVLPALVLLYLLKLRRLPVRIPSTLLWRQAYIDLQANVPFQRLRASLLLLIQFLLLAALLLAFAQPVLTDGAQPAGRIIVLVDVSASMRARDINPDDPQRTRLDEALDRARLIIDNASRSDRQVQIMIATFGRTARVISSFESNRSILLDALERVQPTDEQADLTAALRLTEAFASRAEMDSDPPEVVLLSDGGVGRGEQISGFDLRAGRFRYVRIGPGLRDNIDNVGITAFTARRNYENPVRVDVFGRLTNAAAEPIEVAVTLRADDADPLPLIMTIPAATDQAAGERSFTATLDIGGSALLTLTHNYNDALASDNSAALVVPAGRKPRIAMMHPDSDADADPFIVELLRAADPQELIVMTGEQFAAQIGSAVDAPLPYDFVLFDRVAPQRLPNAPSLMFGVAPPGVNVVEPNETGGKSVLRWDRQHPLMEYVELDAVRFAGFGGFVLPARAEPLAWGPDGPIIAVLQRGNTSHVAVGFELRRSDWPLHVSFAVFMQNVLDQLVAAGGAAEAFGFQPGASISVEPKLGSRVVEIAGPLDVSVSVDGPGPVILPPLRLVGVYELTGVQPSFHRLPTNVLSDQESDTRPAATLRVNAESVGAESATDAAARPLWPVLIAAAFLLAILEWIVWCLRSRG